MRIVDKIFGEDFINLMQSISLNQFIQTIDVLILFISSNVGSPIFTSTITDNMITNCGTTKLFFLQHHGQIRSSHRTITLTTVSNSTVKMPGTMIGHIQITTSTSNGIIPTITGIVIVKSITKYFHQIGIVCCKSVNESRIT